MPLTNGSGSGKLNPDPQHCLPSLLLAAPALTLLLHPVGKNQSVKKDFASSKHDTVRYLRYCLKSVKKYKNIFIALDSMRIQLRIQH
jgi:hypothetical protein